RLSARRAKGDGRRQFLPETPVRQVTYSQYNKQRPGPYPGLGEQDMSLDKEKFAGGVAVITGAGAGIGMGLARRAGALGMTVVVTDINGAAAEKVAGEIRESGGKAEAMVVDVSKPAELDRLADEVFAR